MHFTNVVGTQGKVDFIVKAKKMQELYQVRIRAMGVPSQK